MEIVKVHLIDSTLEEVAEAIKEGEDILLATDDSGGFVVLEYNFREDKWNLEVGREDYRRAEEVSAEELQDPEGLLEKAHRIIHSWLEPGNEAYWWFLSEYAEWEEQVNEFELYYVPCVICADCGKEIIKREEAGYYKVPTRGEDRYCGPNYFTFLSSDYKEAKMLLEP